MTRGSHVGRSAFVVAAAAGVAGLLTYTPPATELRAAGGPAPQRVRPIVSGPFTATPASVPFPVKETMSPPPPTALVAAPPVTDAPPPPTSAPPDTEVAAAPDAPPEVAQPQSYEPEPEPEPADSSDEEDQARPHDTDDHCTLFDNLLTVLDDGSIRAAVATVGCI